MRKIFLIYGDPSAHLLAVHLTRQLKKQKPDIEIKGLGSRELTSEGVEILYDLVSLSVVGIFEVLKNILKFRKIFQDTVTFLKKYQPDCVILIDYPGFNLRMAHQAKKMGIKVIYYVSPQVWAWNSARIKQIKKNVDLMLVIFKFEEELYKKSGVPVYFVGYPRMQFIKEEISPEEFRKHYHLKSNGPFIGIMPGSRKTEIKYTLPIILKGAHLIKKDYPYTTFIILRADKIEESFIRKFTLKYDDLNIVMVNQHKYSAIKFCNALIVCSGTSTLEVSLLEKPFIIVYKLSNLTYHLLKRMVKTPFIGMVNILLGKMLIPELIQEKLTPQNIYKHITAYLDDKDIHYKTITELKKIREILEGEDSFKKSAQIILNKIL